MRQDIITAMQGLSKIYKETLSDDLIEIWVTVLSELNPKEIAEGVKKYILAADSVFFPKPGQIYALARPKTDSRNEAMVIVDRIFYSLKSYGTDEYNKGRARAKIGKEGWAFIENKGGWQAFSDSITDNDQVPILQAQARDSIIAILQRRDAGLDYLPSLDKREDRVQIQGPEANGKAMEVKNPFKPFPSS